MGWTLADHRQAPTQQTNSNPTSHLYAPHVYLDAEHSALSLRQGMGRHGTGIWLISQVLPALEMRAEVFTRAS